jgi:ATP-binding cassette, subfamily B, bacterial
MHGLRARIHEYILMTFRFQKALSYVWAAGPIWVIGNLLLLLVQGLLPMLSLYMMKLLIDSVSSVLSQPAANRSFDAVIHYLVLTGIVALVSAVVSQVNDVFSNIQSMTVADYMNDILQEKALDIDLEYYENPQYQNTLHRAQREASYRPVLIINSLAQIAQNAISLAGIAWLLLAFHWSIVPLLLVAVVPGVLVRIYYSDAQYKLDRKVTPRERQSEYYYYVMASIDLAKEVRIFGLGKTVRSRYQALRKEIRGLRLKAEINNSIWSTLAQVVSVVVIYGLFALIAYRTLQGNQTLGDLVMFFQAAQRGESFLRWLLLGLARLYENNLFLSNLYEFLDLEKHVKEPDEPLKVPTPIQKGIQFENVSFSYPGSSRTVLKDINFSVKAGEIIALVGENGAGKTTLVKLLCRLYDPSGGKIKIDHTDLRQYQSTDLRRQIGVVFQDYAHYDLPASDNIWFGGVHHPKDMAKIRGAARLSDVDDVISGLKKGYDTVLGNMFENGEELSIGQWQKVAIARAFFRDSQVLILDEPTSALDPKAEYEFFLKMRKLLNNRTALLISHRMSTVRMADRIYVIQDGRIVENGTHEELIEAAGTYAQLFEQQAQNYR